MSRPTKTGLDYFPLDVDMDQDDKMFFIEAKYGLTGFAIVIRMFMRIYREEGYYCHYSDNKEAYIIAKRLSEDVNVIKNVVNDCINEGIFHKELYEKHGILTSRGIQKRYLKACSRRKEVLMIQEYLLINPSDYDNLVIDNNNPVNDDINPNNCKPMSAKNPQSKVNKSKVNKSTSTPPKPSPNGDDNDALIDSCYKKIINTFNNNIHPATPLEAQNLSTWLSDGMEAGLIIWAIKQAVLQGKRSMKYIDAILVNLKGEGITTLDQAEARERDREQAKKKRWTQEGGPKPREPSVPELTEEEKKRLDELNEQIKKLSEEMEIPP